MSFPFSIQRGTIIYGTDISKDSIDIAGKKSIYSDLYQWDAMNKVPYKYGDNTFDAITCIGTLTYCQDFPSLFKEWTRISKPGAIIIMTHRSDLMKADKPHFDKMVATSKWKKIQHLVNQPYLPKNENYGSNIYVEYFVVRNNKKMSKM